MRYPKGRGACAMIATGSSGEDEIILIRSNCVSRGSVTEADRTLSGLRELRQRP